MFYNADVFSVPFKPNANVYSVYSNEETIKLDVIPAMKFTDGNVSRYRVDGYYFTAADISTSVFETNKLDKILHLRYGTVLYTTNKRDAEKFARGLRSKMVEQKKAEIEKLKADVTTLLKIKTTFEDNTTSSTANFSVNI